MALRFITRFAIVLMSGNQKTRVFVLLGPGFGADSWRSRFERGLIPGLNERLPYGYWRAEGEGWSIEYSQDHKESSFGEFFRRGLARALGFDLIHAWRNRKALLSADVVWTHTEREHLAALLLFRLLARSRRPAIIAQCVWLFDVWPRLSAPKRALYRYLLRDADVVTTQSPEDLRAARQVLPRVVTEMILSGAAADRMCPPRRSPVSLVCRVLAVGNDMHRDWETLVRALAGRKEFEVCVATAKREGLADGFDNVRVCSPTTAREIENLYEWADIVVVPLKQNLHASGITAIFEAVVSGVPVIAADTGGLRAYFDDQEICYVPPASPNELREAVQRMAADEEGRYGLATAAQEKLIAANLTKQGYADRHRQLTEKILEWPARVGAGSKPSRSRSQGSTRAFVFLGPGFGGESWQRRYEKGLIPGLNEKLPYGYWRAEGNGWSIEYSQDRDESRVLGFFRRGFARVLGFDLIHAWRNRKPMLAADIVWTYTERENLAALLLFRLQRKSQPPAIIAQCVWLFDLWPTLSWPKRALYRYLLRHADAVTTHSYENLAAAKRLLPNVRAELVKFGAPSDVRVAARKTACKRPVRLVAVGNDIHRDWETLVKAFAGKPAFELLLATRRFNLRPSPNIKTIQATTAAEIERMYEWADFAVVPLKPNLHASGITVICEAIACGVPVVCTDTGGLEIYFSPEEICYTPPGEPEQLLNSVSRLADDEEGRYQMVLKAQRRLNRGDFTSEANALAHRALSEQILSRCVSGPETTCEVFSSPELT